MGEYQLFLLTKAKECFTAGKVDFDEMAEFFKSHFQVSGLSEELELAIPSETYENVKLALEEFQAALKSKKVSFAMPEIPDEDNSMTNEENLELLHTVLAGTFHSRRVAVKVIPGGRTNAQEARVLSALAAEPHPNILQLQACFAHGNELLLVTELICGSDLETAGRQLGFGKSWPR